METGSIVVGILVIILFVGFIVVRKRKASKEREERLDEGRRDRNDRLSDRTNEDRYHDRIDIRNDINDRR